MDQKSDYKYWESFFQSLQMTYYSLLAAPLFLFAIVFLRAENGNARFFPVSAQKEDWLVGITAALAIVVSLMLHFVASGQYKQAAKEDDLKIKLEQYKKATLRKYVGLAIFQVITVLVFGMTYHNGLMGLFTALLLYSSFFRPELQNAKRDLRLSKQEYQQIDYKNAIIT